ncbi:hypothetical protein UCDDA912_g01094 [Diaporthe ampelina]|uniref:Uncharacterized protein n=1 Tax=Diaporthe ampelina TaxID=1214573 RepID=A0A0G2HVT2_9PEZI|nr:hypothetical protein UCDDA912_g01094 [Diaporthe ampelina]
MDSPSKLPIPVTKMKSKLSIIFAIAQMILLAFAAQPNPTNPTNVTAMSYGCFKSGELWKDLGTNESILAAYDEQWCKLAVGTWDLGEKSNRCIRDDPIKHAFMWKWEITKVPDGKDKGYVSHTHNHTHTHTHTHTNMDF